MSERCMRCHRKLKDVELLKIGMGPVCRKKAAAELAMKEQETAVTAGQDAQDAVTLLA